MAKRGQQGNRTGSRKQKLPSAKPQKQEKGAYKRCRFHPDVVLGVDNHCWKCDKHDAEVAKVRLPQKVERMTRPGYGTRSRKKGRT